jgi:hypothetical protein
MSFTQQEYVVQDVSGRNIDALSYGGKELVDESVKINAGDPFLQTDLGIIVKAFEVESSNWKQNDYAKAHCYRDVYSTKNFSQRVREQMNYYPGMHQTSGGIPATDPFYENAKEMADDRLGFWNSAMDNPDAFMNALRQKQADFDYADIFGSDVSAKDRAKAIGKMLTECIPCFDRLLDGMQLLPDGDLLEIHMLNIKIRTDLLDKIMALFKDPGAFVNICDLLKMLTHLCPQDLLAILALLTQYLAKLNLDFRFNIDFIIQLVGPILSPFLDALSQWLDKWIQLIIGPLVCVVDHINETILLAQSMQIPFSDVSMNISMDIGGALPFQQNVSKTGGFGGSAGFGDSSQGIFQKGVADPHASAWTGWQWEEFATPDKEKYNPSVPDYPVEETQMAAQEAKDAWTDGANVSEAERAERDKRWKELRETEEAKRRAVPPPEKPEDPRDGTRWSKDDIPNSEKYTAGKSWEGGYNPPEKQTSPKDGTQYFVTTPLVESIVQMRNILQGGIQYVKDWFTYITQMIYDLLGTDFGWMSKKIDNTMLKSKIIELIMLIKSIITAVAKNGLECGTHSNFDQAQLKYILEEELNKFSSNKFRVLDDGTIEMSVGPKLNVQDLSDQAEEQAETVPGLIPGQEITTPAAKQQQAVASGIVIKNCFRSVSQEELQQVRQWIADFEQRGAIG